MLKGIVTVTLKQDVLDPQGQAVQEALKTLGFPEVQNVRIGKSIEVLLEEDDVKTAESRLREMSATLLVNAVIEDYRLKITEV